MPIADGQVPKATDYHSLLVSSSNPRVLLLGTHDGIFRSTDAGATWRAAGMKGDDAMNLVQSGPLTLMGGHDVFAVSRDGGVTWRATSPKGLPGLDVHGLARIRAIRTSSTRRSPVPGSTDRRTAVRRLRCCPLT
ncbi:MAG: sialidase family protein [Actinomycetes bacterium]